jgi:hypothetical protein
LGLSGDGIVVIGRDQNEQFPANHFGRMRHIELLPRRLLRGGFREWLRSSAHLNKFHAATVLNRQHLSRLSAS